MATTYSTKAKAEAAITGSKYSKAKAKSWAYKQTSDYSGWWEGYGLGRTHAVGSGNNELRYQFHSFIPYDKVKDFEVDVELYYSKAGKWAEMGNRTSSLDKTSFVWITTPTSMSPTTKIRRWTYLFDAPNDTDVTQVRVRVRPRPESRTVTHAYYEAKKTTKDKKTVYVLEKKEYSATVDWFTADWTPWQKIAAPALADSKDEKAKLAAAAPKRPSKPSASLLAGGYVDVTFDKIDPATADTCRVVYRMQDGAYLPGAPVTLVTKTHKDIPANTEHWTDYTVQPGHQYRYYVRAHNNRSGQMWDDFDAKQDLPAALSEPVNTAPVAVEGVSVSAYSADTARVEFSIAGYPGAVEDVKVYWTDDYALLAADTWEGCSNVSLPDPTKKRQTALCQGLEAGKEYWFAIYQATGSERDQRRLDTSAAWKTTIGARPEPPTVVECPSAVAYDIDEPASFTVRWTHNAPDGSAQTAAQVSLSSEWPGIAATADVAGDVQQGEVEFSVTSAWVHENIESALPCRVRVRTKGAAGEWSDYSEAVAVTLYPRAVCELSIAADSSEGDYGIRVEKLPVRAALRIVAAKPSPYVDLYQQAVRWTLSVKAAEDFSYTDEAGNFAWVSSGETVYERSVDYYDGDFATPSMELEIGALDSVFASGAAYTATLSAFLDSGLSAEEDSASFDVAFASSMPQPFASVSPGALWTADIYPSLSVEREVEDGMLMVYDDGVLRVSEGFDAGVDGYGRYGTVTGLRLQYTNDNGEAGRTADFEWDGEAPAEVPMLPEDGVSAVEGIRLLCEGSAPVDLHGLYTAYPYPETYGNAAISVYRVNHDGSMSEVASGLPSVNGLLVTDRHPTFGEMSYRVVANDLATDEVTVCDVAGTNPWRSILLQWDEPEDGSWASEDEEHVLAPGFEFVELPWNITVQQKSAKDVALKNYIGRAHPVALYGTQTGETGSWSCEIVKFEEDHELAQLRRLAADMGQCWVRDPSGMSYPASVDVSVSRSYDSAAVSVQLEVTRVDGD